MRFTSIRNALIVVGAAFALAGGGATLAKAPGQALTLTAVHRASVSTRVEAPDTATEPTTPDTDNIQSGDQTGPDGTVIARHTAIRHTAKIAHPQRAAKATASQTGPENNETGSETEAASDGPGGHADPAGQNVDHQFEGVE